MVHPIWKDYFVNLGTAESVEFVILHNGSVVYRGKSWKRPGQSDNIVRINDICADYILESSSLTGGGIAEFQVYIDTGMSMQLKDTILFLNDWSYDYAYNPETMGLSFPVINRIDNRQWLVFTAYDANTITARIKLADGSTFDVFVPVKISDDFNNDFNYDFSQSVKSMQVGTAVFNLSRWDNIDSVIVEDKEFKVVSGCNRYALYYVNAYGGWDSLLIEGNYSEADNLVRHTRETEYDNRSIQNRGVYNYVNEIVKTMTLHTSWLSDDESSRMHHLLNSTNVYLGDLVTGQMIPVILTDTKTDYKTYKGNGGKLVNYTINVTIAQERIRR